MSDIRRVLRHWAYAAGYIEAELDAVVDRAYDMVAHELAEKIRTTDLPEIHVDMFDNGTQWAADLIDPEVTP